MDTEQSPTEPTPPVQAESISEKLARCLTNDRHRLGRLLKQGGDEAEAEFQRSAARFLEREQRRPEIKYDEQLPITAHREEVVAAIKSHPVVLVCGETGSGKSTQLPKFCLEAGYGVGGLIGRTRDARRRRGPPSAR